MDYIIKLAETSPPHNITKTEPICSADDDTDEMYGAKVKGKKQKRMRHRKTVLPPLERKNASSIWTMMSKCGPGLAKCNVCGKEFRCDSSTSNVLRHIRNNHNALFELEREETLKSSSMENKRKSSSNFKFLNSLQRTQDLANINRLTKNKPEGTKNRSELVKKRVVDQKQLAMICKDLQPFSFVDNIGFKEFCYELDPRYELPSKRALKQSMLSLYTEKKKDLIDMLAQVKSVAITTESWTTVNKERFLTVTAHFFESFTSWKLHSTVLATRPENESDGSAEALAGLINEVLDDFDIKSKVNAATSDNCVVKEHLKVLHVQCFAHTLNQIVKDAIESTQGFSSFVDSIKAIAFHFQQSEKSKSRLKLFLDDMGMKEFEPNLPQEAPGRWISTLTMLESYIEIHQAVSATLLALGHAELMVLDHDVDLAKGWCESLDPFAEAAKMMFAEKMTSLSQILVIVRQLQHYLTEEATQTVLSVNLLQELSDRFMFIEENFTTSAATLLDPRFKRLPFANDDLRKKHEGRIINMMDPNLNTAGGEKNREATRDDQNQATPKRRSFMESFVVQVKEKQKSSAHYSPEPEEELEKYMGMEYLEIEKDPNLWWQFHSALFPRLSPIARKFAFIPATSVPAERIFSKAGEVFSKKRSCLEPSIVDMMLFLNKQYV